MEPKFALEVDDAPLAGLCRRWRVEQFVLFGSLLRQDFGPDSDVDLLVRFDADVHWSLIDLVQMEQELAALLGRPVDLVTYRGLESSKNWMRRQEILATARVIYADRRVSLEV